MKKQTASSKTPSGKRALKRIGAKDQAPAANRKIVTQNPKPALVESTPDTIIKPVLAPPPVQDHARDAIGFMGHTLLSSAFRFIEPSWRNYIKYVDAESRAGNQNAARYLKAWLDLPPSERRSHMPEQICELANVESVELIRWVSGQVWLEGSAKSSMCMSFMRDQVLESTARFAMQSPDNYKHADLFLKASGAIPVSSGGRAPRQPVNNIFMPVVNSESFTSSNVRGEAAAIDRTDRSGLRDMDSEIIELSKVMQSNASDSGLDVMPEDDVPDDKEDEDGDGDGDESEEEEE